MRGRPFIENVGRIEIGDNFRLNSGPVQSHLVTGHKGRIEIGHDVSIDFGAAVASHGHVTIGNRVRLGPLAMILDTNFHDVVVRDMRPEAGTIIIGDDVRIGSRVTILKNSVIGSGACILPGSVVTGYIPPGATAGGVPARVLEPLGDSPPTRASGVFDDTSALLLTGGMRRVVEARCLDTAEPMRPRGLASRRAARDDNSLQRGVLHLQSTSVALSAPDLSSCGEDLDRRVLRTTSVPKNLIRRPQVELSRALFPPSSLTLIEPGQKANKP